MKSESSDVIEVRPDEGFQVTTLAAYLDGRVEGATGEPTVRQFAGGHANLTYLLSYPTVDLVLRRPPLGPVAPGSHDMGREYGVLSKLYRAFPPAPRAHLLCEDETVIGAPFLIMERKEGVVVRNGVPEIFGGGKDEKANRQLSEVVVDTLAAFHLVDPAVCGLDQIGRPEGFLGRQVDGWRQRWEASRHQENQVADEVARWVADHIPQSILVTLLHNDWRLDNMAVSPEDPSQCVAVYDWDMCTRGDPLADLGTLLAAWYEGDEVPATLNPMPTTASGFMNRAQAIERYHSLTGFPIEAVNWYVVFGTWKVAVVLQQIFIRWHRGQTSDARFARMAEGAQRLFELASSRLQKPS